MKKKKSLEKEPQRAYNISMRTFVFDLYNTLIEVRTDEHCKETWQPVVEYFGGLGINSDWKTLCDLFDGYWKMFNAKTDSRYAYPECDCVAQFEYIAHCAGGEISRDQATEALRLMRKASVRVLRLFDGIKELFEKLKQRGAKLYLLSNAQAAFTYDEIEECGLNGAFDGLLLSSECGCRKPDPMFFGMLFDKYGLDKRDAVMVGDDPVSDGKGAADFGIKYVRADGGAAVHAAELVSLADGK